MVHDDNLISTAVSRQKDREVVVNTSDWMCHEVSLFSNAMRRQSIRAVLISGSHTLARHRATLIQGLLGSAATNQSSLRLRIICLGCLIMQLACR